MLIDKLAKLGGDPPPGSPRRPLGVSRIITHRSGEAPDINLDVVAFTLTFVIDSHGGHGPHPVASWIGARGVNDERCQAKVHRSSRPPRNDELERSVRERLAQGNGDEPELGNT